MSEAIKKFKEILDGVKTVAVCVGTAHNTQKLIAATLLHRTFEHLGKRSVFELPSTAKTTPSDPPSLAIDRVTLGVDEKTKQFLTELCGSWETKNPHEHLVIRLNTHEAPVAELKYEKEGDTLKIILEGSDNLDPARVSVQKERSKVDLLLLIEPAVHEIENLLASLPHRDVVKLTAKDRPLAVKVADIVMALVDPLPKEFRHGVWHLLDKEEKTTDAPLAEISEMKQKLIALGVDREVVYQARANFLGSSFWKLLGRALARCEFEKNIHTIWSFLPYTDFQKTNQDGSAIPHLLEEIQKLRPEGTFTTLLWEDKDDTNNAKRIRAVIAGKTESVIAPLALALGAQSASRYFFLDGFETFSEAELKIRSSIQQLQNTQ